MGDKHHPVWVTPGLTPPVHFFGIQGERHKNQVQMPPSPCTNFFIYTGTKWGWCGSGTWVPRSLEDTRALMSHTREPGPSEALSPGRALSPSPEHPELCASCLGLHLPALPGDISRCPPRGWGDIARCPPWGWGGPARASALAGGEGWGPFLSRCRCSLKGKQQTVIHVWHSLHEQRSRDTRIKN